MEPEKTLVYLGLGSNLGDREANLLAALRLLRRGVELRQISSIYETEPLGYREQPWFLNLVYAGSTQLGPHELLDFVKWIERQLGRRPNFPNAPRSIDIDLLFYGTRVINTAALTIPHPRLSQRLFVLIPLAEIAPEFFHPVEKKTIRELLEGFGKLQKVRKWGPPPVIEHLAEEG